MEKWQTVLSRMLREDRHAYQISVRQQADRIGVTHPTLLKWESGDIVPSGESQIKLARYFGLPETPFSKVIEGRMRHRELLLEQIMHRLRLLSEDDLRFARRMLEALVIQSGQENADVEGPESSAGSGLRYGEEAE